MKKIPGVFFFLLCILLCVPLLLEAHASVVPLKSSISKVIVYSDRAEVIRTARAAIRKGQTRLVVSHLPFMLMDDSVQVNVSGKAKILDVEIKRTFPVKSANEKILKLESEIKDLKNQDQSLLDEEKNLDSQQVFLDSINAATAGKISREFLAKIPAPEDIKSIMSFVYQEKQLTCKRLRLAAIERQEIQDEIKALEKELHQISNIRRKETKAVTIVLTAKEDTNIEIFLHYLIMKASWRPRYQARLISAGGGEVELTVIADVRQKTGEDWNQVSLVLSTATPLTGAKAPELRPWYLNFRHPPRPVGGRERKVLMSADAVNEGEARMRENAAPVRIKVGETTVNFELNGQPTIPSDWSFHKTILTQESFHGKIGYIAVPRLKPRAFLRASLKNETAYPLLTGKVDIFHGAQYIGHSRIKTIAPEQPFDLDMGIDENLKVKRELVKKNEKETGIFEKEREIHYLFKITLESFKTKPCSLIVMDQIPVSQNDQIKVITDVLEPEPVKRSAKGFITWELEMAPLEKKEISLSYTVRFPKDKEITGIE